MLLCHTRSRRIPSTTKQREWHLLIQNQYHMSRLMGLELLWTTRLNVRVSVKFFGSPSKEETLHFGFAKDTSGILRPTAGVIGLINVLLMMQHGKIPARASFASLNSNISSLEDDRMPIPTTTRTWVSSSCLICINSYWAAGSDAIRPGQGATATRQNTPFSSPRHQPKVSLHDTQEYWRTSTISKPSIS